MSSVVYRYEVPVDGRVHGHRLHGPVLHVACRQPDVVEFWAHHHNGNPPVMHYFRVYGTGHTMPAYGLTYHGTGFHDGLVWHLFSGIRDELQRGAVR